VGRPWASAGIVLLLLAACGSEPGRPVTDPSPPEEGDVAPAFELQSADGSTLSSQDFEGRRMLLYFSMGPG
jgi:cytochrome oxidase Cu insertion factor (SCO1/SenC/PrrC family)